MSVSGYLDDSGLAERAWQVGALCRAIADALDSRFNPVRVLGELTGFSRAASGHCYFSLKDANGQLRCAMFRRAAGLLDFNPRDGELVEVRGKLGVYEPRGELQLVVESMARAGQGTLFEQFLQIKERLEKEGLFDASRKRDVPNMPRAIGVVTSLGAAAWHDVMTALQRRVPHIPVVLAPATVQGAGAAQEIIQALDGLFAMAANTGTVVIDVILLVRGGGAIEDLWAFNDEALARMIARSPVPVVCGVGHETDFTIADFVADLRAPTPTAAAELASRPAAQMLEQLDVLEGLIHRALMRCMDRESQKLDRIAARLGRPSGLTARQSLRLAALSQRLEFGLRTGAQTSQNRLEQAGQALPRATQLALRGQREALERLAHRLQAVNPKVILKRGYAWVVQEDGRPVSSARQAQSGQQWTATLADGTVDLQVLQAHPD